MVMKQFLIILLFIGVFISENFVIAQVDSKEKNTIKLPNGWKISPPGKQIRLGDFPIQQILHPSKKWIVVIHSGQSDQSLMVINTKNNSVTDSFSIDQTFYGGVFSNCGSYFYVSNGNRNKILKLKFKNGKLNYQSEIVLGLPWPNRISPTGMCLSSDETQLFVITKEDSSLYKVNLENGAVKKCIKIKSEGYSLVLDHHRQFIWASEWGNKSIVCYDIKKDIIICRILVGSNPNEMIIDNRNGQLFVACANDNTVHTVDLLRNRVVEVLNTSLYAESPTGSTPNALGLDTLNRLLFIANADNNNICIFNIQNVGESKSLGFFSTGWYPTQVLIVNGMIYITNGKGNHSMPNLNGPNPIAKKNQVEYQGGIKNQPVQYIGSLFRGTLQIVDLEFIMRNLKSLTDDVYLNTPFRIEQMSQDMEIPEGNPIPQKVNGKSPIEHVFYIIKENRTYDQVLSDVSGGNGDTNLLLFGENITPNQHKLVKEFVLLDNFYVDAEVSADGHNWSTAAIANDFTEKNWPISYGGRGGDYVFEGQSLAATPNKGFLWDYAKKYNISYRSYGEFADDYKANISALENHICPYYTSWDERVKDTTRFSQWRRDFDSLLHLNQVPQLNTLRFINDHTEGVRKGRPTPFAHVADNDYAVGLFIEYLSKSEIWGKSVVFILEDDAQNGADHVDAHRSTAYVAGGFVKRNYIDHTNYSTSSMLRTIELILGISPMSQYDASAKSMWRCFNDTVNYSAFTSVIPLVNLNEICMENQSKSTSKLMQMSEKLDLSKEDKCNEDLMNDILWKYVHGENSIKPATQRAYLRIE